MFIHESMKLSKLFLELSDENHQMITREFRRDIDQIREKLWVIELLTVEAFIKKPSHWKELFKECRIPDIEPNEDMTFTVLI